MLPTSGLFKDIDCPYYDNYCGRPYCHFRHRKRNTDSAEDSQDGESATSDFPTYKPTPKSQLAQVKSHIPISYVPDTVLRPERLSRVPTTYNYTDKITYKPTPLSELSKNTAINTTAELMNKELLSNIEGNNKEDEHVTMDVIEYRDEENCDIDFEELSTEFDMIDDIINECPSVADEEDKESQSNTIAEEEPKDSTVSSGTKSSKSHSSKESHSKTKDDKSKHSKSGSSTSGSSNRHKTSHKSKTKSDHHRRSRSREKHKEKSSDKHKDDKKRDKEPKKSSSSKDKRESDSSNSNKDGKHHRSSKDSKSSKSSSRSASSSSKHKDTDNKHTDREKEKSKKDKRKKEESQKKSEKPVEVPKYTLSDDEDRDIDDLFNEDLEEECYRIFNEYKPEVRRETEVTEQPKYKPQEIVEEYVPTSKKRIAHFGAEQYVSKLNPVKLKPSQNAALQFTNRYKIAREAQMKEENDIEAVLSKHGSKRPILEAYKNLKKAKVKTDESSKVKKLKEDKQQSTSLVDEIINGKSNAPVVYNPTPISKLNAEELKGNIKPLRIAPAMNASTMQQAKARMIAEMAKKKESSSKTPMQTLGRGNKRVAHIPDTALAELPDVLQPESKKIPVNVRTRYLTMIADECVKLYLSKEDAYNRAQGEEFKVMERCAAIVTYRNSAMLAVNRIRRELHDREAKGLGPISSGESTASNETNQFRGKRFYDNIARYILKEDELEEHGYPRESSTPGKAVIKSQKQLPRVNLDDNQRLCCRCFKVYLVDNRGFPLYAEDCLYHPLKKRTLKGERIYLCCKSTEDTGCVTSNTHVSESEESDLLGYQTTMEPERDDDPRSHSVYALDCEMCYTTKGLELTRVTIVDCDCKTVYESLVKPLNPIIDYNTTFSGITKEQMDRTSTSILQVQANILHLCNSSTILIGHSLESDMKALKIVHSRIIDTSIMFPHRLGLPHKRALRTLASEYLNKIIQSDVAGHDSAEDAITCMELVIWKLKEDLKVKGIK